MMRDEGGRMTGSLACLPRLALSSRSRVSNLIIVPLASFATFAVRLVFSSAALAVFAVKLFCSFATSASFAVKL